MLDSFGKRLNSQLVASPGDISVGDRWAIGGHFKPTPWSAGRLALTLGALAASFVGTHTAPPIESFAQSDRWRLEFVPLPGLQDVYNRYAYAGHFLFQGDGTRTGRVAATLGQLGASLRGTAATLTIDGRVSATLGSLGASLRGVTYYDHFFDVDYSITPNFVVTDMPPSSGAITAALGGLTTALRGSALPPDSSSGRIQATLGALSAALQGTMTPPAARDGRLHLDLGTLSAALRGAAVPPQGVVGGVQARLAGVTASLRGTFTPFAATGLIDAQLGALGVRFNGQFIEAGAIIGLINAQLGGVTAHLRGIAAITIGTLSADSITVEPALSASIEVDPALSGSLRTTPIT